MGMEDFWEQLPTGKEDKPFERTGFITSHIDKRPRFS